MNTMRRGISIILLTIIGLLVLYQSHPSGEELWKCACQKCIAGGDEWFMARFNQTVDPFFTRQSSLSNQTFLWWKTLQGDNSDFGTFRRVMDQVFQHFPDGQGFMDSGPWRCRRCSVVGNSGNLQASHYGPLIDLSDIVFRMNGAPTKGHEDDVGKKTTFHLMYPESAVHLDSNTHLVLFPFKTQDLQWLVSAFTTGSITFTYQPVKAKIKANKDLVMILNPEFIKYVCEMWLQKKGKYPSTGFLGLMLAMHICDEVNVFGFGADIDGNWRHYWEELKNKYLKTGPHSGNQEYQLIQKLAEKMKINLYPGR